MPSSTQSSPKVLVSCATSIMRGSCPSSVDNDKSPFAPAGQRRQRIADAKVDDHHAEEDWEGGERALYDLARSIGELPSAHHRGVGGLLDGGERGVEQRRDGEAHGLREHHVREDLC